MGIIKAEDLGRLSPVFRGKGGQKLAKFFMRLMALDKINDLCDRSSHCTGADFASSMLEDLGVDYMVGNSERLKQLPERAFITISNHPYGGVDGIILIDLFGHLRPDYKFMVNQVLALVKALESHFISVTPAGNKKKAATIASLRGVRETITHLHEGHPMGFFPSGAVSDFSLKKMRIRDRAWQDNILRLIHLAKVPILPVRFFDTNSRFFYSLGLLNWRIRLLRMPWEVFNKNKKTHRIGIGNLISVEEQKKFKDHKSLGAFLRKNVYEMPMPATFTPKTMIFSA
jgi:putative hemolysin